MFIKDEKTKSFLFGFLLSATLKSVCEQLCIYDFSSFFNSRYEEKIPSIPNTKFEDKIEKKGIDISKNSDVSMSNTETDQDFESFDLFKGENQAKASDHDNLIDLEQETKEIDDKVLEIPAFLRRQAN